MVAENIAFGVLAAAMAISAIGVVTTKNVVHAALFLVVVLAGGAGQFLLLGQEFVAWVQVLVYIGAVIVLFLFGIMLTRAPMHPEDSLDNDLKWPGLVVSLFLGGILAALLIDAFDNSKVELEHPTRTIEVTNSLFRTYIIPFEVVGILLLAALIGAVVLAEKGLRRPYACCSNQFLLLARVLVLHRHLRRADPQAHRARVDERRADARGGEHQPRRVRRVQPHGRRARCSRCSCSRSRPRRSASDWRSSCSSIATCTAPISTTSTF